MKSQPLLKYMYKFLASIAARGIAKYNAVSKVITNVRGLRSEQLN